MKLLDLLIDITIRSGKSAAQLSSIRRSTKKTEETFLGLTGKSAKLAKGILGVGAAAYAAKRGLTALINAGSDYETGLVGVAKTTGLAGAELQSFKNDIKALARNPEIGSTAMELFDLAQVAGTLGIKGRNDLLLFTATMGRLKVASDGKLVGEEAAQSVANIISASGKGIGDIDNLGSAITFLGNNYAVNEAQILSSSTNIAKSLRRFRPAASDVVALGTAFAEMKISPELAGTAVSKTLNKIESAVAGGGKELKEFRRITGLTTADIKEMLKTDAAGLFAAFAVGLNRVQSEGESLTTVLDGIKLSDIRTGDTLKSIATEASRMNSVMDDSARAFRENTALEAEAAQAGDTYAKKKQAMGESIKALADTIASTGLMDLMKDFFDAINSGVGAIDKFLNSGHWLLELLDWTAAGFALIYPAAVLLAKALIFFAIPAIKALGRAMFANPIGLFILAVYALVLAFKNWDKILAMAKRVGAALLDLGTKVFGPQFTVMIMMVRKLGEILGKYLWGQIKRLVTLVKQIFSGDFKGAWETMQDIVGAAVNAVLSIFKTLAPNAAAAFAAVYTNAKHWLQDKLGAVFDWAKNKIATVKGWFSGLFKKTDAEIERTRRGAPPPPRAPFGGGGGTAGAGTRSQASTAPRAGATTVVNDRRIEKIEVKIPVQTNASPQQIGRAVRQEVRKIDRGVKLDATT